MKYGELLDDDSNLSAALCRSILFSDFQDQEKVLGFIQSHRDETIPDDVLKNLDFALLGSSNDNN